MPKAAKQRKFTVKDYLNEELWIGGEKTTRGVFIEQMRAAGHSQRAIDMYLFGHERGAAARQRKQQEDWEKGVKEVELPTGPPP